MIRSLTDEEIVLIKKLSKISNYSLCSKNNQNLILFNIYYNCNKTTIDKDSVEKMGNDINNSAKDINRLLYLNLYGIINKEDISDRNIYDNKIKDAIGLFRSV